MYLGRATPMGRAIMALSLDTAAPAQTLSELGSMEGMEVVRQVEL
jgi:hypothetical protein